MNLFLIILTLFTYLSPYVDPKIFWPIALPGLIYPWLLLGNFVFIFFWLLIGHRYWLFSFFCLIVGGTHFLSIVGVSGLARDTVELKQHPIKVTSLNCHIFVRPKSKELVDHAAWKKFITASKPSILCLQELPAGFFTTEKYHRIRETLSDFPYQYHHQSKSKPLTILSKYPILNGGGALFENNSNGYLFSDVEVDKKMIRIFNLHLQSNSVTSIARKVTEGKIQEKETWLNLKGMVARYKNNAKLRAKQAKEIADLIAKSPYPVIVCGDLNDVPQSYTYRLVKGSLKDAFKVAGVGLGITYSGDIPALRIDYVFTDPSLKVLSTGVTKEKNISDHHAVWVLVQNKAASTAR